MKKILTILFTVLAIAAKASPAADVRGAWLMPPASELCAVQAVDSVAGLGFNTLLVRMDSPSGVCWQSATEPLSVLADFSRGDAPSALLDRAGLLGMEAVAVVTPDVDGDDPLAVAALYRELLLQYDFNGVALDLSRIAGPDAGNLYEFLDALTLELQGEFPQLTLRAVLTPDRDGDAARLASDLLDNGVVNGVVLVQPRAVPARILSEQWGDMDGVTVTFPDVSAADEARWQRKPWGVAFAALPPGAAGDALRGFFAADSRGEDAASRSVAGLGLFRDDQFEASCNNGTITVAHGAAPATIDVYNLSGILVKSVRSSGSTATVECSSLSPGVYLVAVRGSSLPARKVVVR